MGCAPSRQEEAEEVRVCGDRKSYTKGALAQRSRLASAHAAYLQSLRRLSLTLCYYASESGHHRFLQSSAPLAMNCLTSGWSAPVHHVAQWPPSPQTFRVDSAYPLDSEQAQQWDSMWNLFAELDDSESTDDEDEDERSELETQKGPGAVQVNNDQQLTSGIQVEEEAPEFTVYMSRRPANMADVMKDIESQFLKIIASADEVSRLLEVSPLLNGQEEPFETFSSHRATLDRLHEWEKRLYEEVKSGEKVRLAYEKRCRQLKNQDLDGAEPSAMDRTTAAIRDLRSRLNVSLAAIESMSRRIAALCDEELQPQIVELIKGLGKMWGAVAAAHRTQRRTIYEAGAILSSETPGPAPPRSAATLAAELRGWRANFTQWIDAQREYAAALAGWAGSCSGGEPATEMSAVCMAWASAIGEFGKGEVEAATKGVERFATAVVAVEEERKRGEGKDGRAVLFGGSEGAFAEAAAVAGVMAARYEELMEALETEARDDEDS